MAGIVKAGELFPAHEMNEIRENQEDHMTEIAPAPVCFHMIVAH